VATSLDMALPDPDSEAGKADWGSLLERVLPHVDVFLPSLEETLYMLDRRRYEALEAASPELGLVAQANGELLEELSGRLLNMGAAMVGLKLGDQGLYLRTTASPDRMEAVGGDLGVSREMWRSRELLAPCFGVEVVGTTGAGDCTIAGFLTGMLKGLTPEQTMTGAVAVGACNVERADATSGVRSWKAVQDRVAGGWERLPVTIALPGWTWKEDAGLWTGPEDQLATAD